MLRWARTTHVAQERVKDLRIAHAHDRRLVRIEPKKAHEPNRFGRGGLGRPPGPPQPRRGPPQPSAPHRWRTTTSYGEPPCRPCGTTSRKTNVRGWIGASGKPISGRRSNPTWRETERNGGSPRPRTTSSSGT